RRETRPADRKHHRAVRAAGLPPLLHPALRLHAVQGRVRRMERMARQRRLLACRDPQVAARVPRALFCAEPVQAQRDAEWPESRFRRLALAARRLAGALRRERKCLDGGPVAGARQVDSYCGLIPAALRTACVSSISLRTYSVNSGIDMFPGSVPSFSKRSRKSALASAVFTSLLMRAARSAGMPAGPHSPSQSVYSKPGYPCSATVGTLDSRDVRFGPDTASAIA